jgi:hypothetical protein
MDPQLRASAGHSAQWRVALRSRPAKIILAVTVTLGVLGAIATAFGLPANARTFAAINASCQLILSVGVAFLGVLALKALRRPTTVSCAIRAVLAALVLAAGVGLLGVVVSAIATALTPSSAPVGPGYVAVLAAAASPLVQMLAQLVGTGMGLLLPRRPVFGCLLTVLLPLGVWPLVGLVEALHPAREWLTPFGAVSGLLSGSDQVVPWLQWLTVVIIWGGGLTGVGIRHATSR